MASRIKYRSSARQTFRVRATELLKARRPVIVIPYRNSIETLKSRQSHCLPEKTLSKVYAVLLRQSRRFLAIDYLPKIRTFFAPPDLSRTKLYIDRTKKKFCIIFLDILFQLNTRENNNNNNI